MQTACGFIVWIHEYSKRYNPNHHVIQVKCHTILFVSYTLHEVLEKGGNSKKEISIDKTMKNKNSQ